MKLCLCAVLLVLLSSCIPTLVAASSATTIFSTTDSNTNTADSSGTESCTAEPSATDNDEPAEDNSQTLNIDTVPQVQVQSKKSLSVLLVPFHGTSHIIVMSALGEALVHRGHNVTLYMTEREGNNLPKKLAERAGMTLLSAGPDVVPTVVDMLNMRASHQQSSKLKVAMEAIKRMYESTNLIAKSLRSNPRHATKWDVIISDYVLAKQLTCVSEEWQVPIVIFSTTLDYSVAGRPQWPFPLDPFGTFDMSTDNMTFSQRLASLVLSTSGSIVEHYLYRPDSSSPSCMQYKHHPSDGYVPTLYSTAFGFEFPRPVLPLKHYLGPFILKPQELIPDDLNNWLAEKPENSVIYISMGSGARLTKQAGSALIEGLLQTNYSILWSLRASNRDILEGFTLETEHFYIAEWVPQLEVLGSPAVKLAVLHGGMGGIHEALYNAVPSVVVPTAYDQYDVAARTQHTGAGVYLDKKALTASSVQSAIEKVASPEYKEAAKKLQKILRQAGGAERGAELVEFYTEVGYDHLVPAYLKYNWSWVQYYNVDVYMLILLITVTVMLVVHRLCTHCCCTRKSKTE